jgi:hypothetical protein
MKSLVTCMCFLITLSACLAEKNPESLFAASDNPVVLVKEATVDVFLSRAEIEAAGGDVEKAMWDKATAKGMKAIMNQFMVEEPLVNPVRSNYPEPAQMSFFSRQGRIIDAPDEVTGDYQQSFRFTANFTPDWKVAGQVVRLEHDRYAVSMLDRMSVVLFDYYPLELPCYFLAAQRTPEGDGNLLRIVGSGKLVQALGTKAMATVEGTSVQGTLCQAELTETNNEIYEKDMIFLLPVKARALEPAAISADKIGQEPDEVIVEPKMIIEETLPEITK